MEATKLREVLELHGKWLRDEAGGVRANLREANLRGTNLYGTNLSGANLREADLRGAYLSGANLSEANLSGANLRGAYLSGANLSGADLSGADLYDANLNGANLSVSNLSGANLHGANLRGAYLSGADLSETKLYVGICDGVLGLDIRIYSLGKHRVVAYRRTPETEIEVQIGCERHPLAHWLTAFARIGKDNNYTEAEIARYGRYLSLVGEDFV